jgi:hypothetical protein
MKFFMIPLSDLCPENSIDSLEWRLNIVLTHAKISRITRIICWSFYKIGMPNFLPIIIRQYPNRRSAICSDDQYLKHHMSVDVLGVSHSIDCIKSRRCNSLEPITGVSKIDQFPLVCTWPLLLKAHRPQTLNRILFSDDKWVESHFVAHKMDISQLLCGS